MSNFVQLTMVADSEFDNDDDTAAESYASIDYKNAKEQTTEAIEQLQELVRSLQLQVHDLNDLVHVQENMINELHEELNQRAFRRQPRALRWYAVARGSYDEENDVFISGIFDDADRYREATNGAWNLVARSFTSHDDAAAWLEEQRPRVARVNAEYRSPNTGTFSKKWYAVWSESNGSYTIVPTYEEAKEMVSGHADLKQKSFGSYAACVTGVEDELTKRLNTLARVM